jgi:hypothetical protein
MKRLRTLWRGDLPLADAFWTWTVTIGLFVNVSTTILFLMLLTLDRPWMALIAGYAVSVPYNIVAVVGVWRSADRDQAPGMNPDLARAASVILMGVLSLL